MDDFCTKNGRKKNADEGWSWTYGSVMRKEVWLLWVTSVGWLGLWWRRWTGEIIGHDLERNNEGWEMSSLIWFLIGLVWRVVMVSGIWVERRLRMVIALIFELWFVWKKDEWRRGEMCMRDWFGKYNIDGYGDCKFPLRFNERLLCMMNALSVFFFFLCWSPLFLL